MILPPKNRLQVLSEQRGNAEFDDYVTYLLGLSYCLFIHHFLFLLSINQSAAEQYVRILSLGSVAKRSKIMYFAWTIWPTHLILHCQVKVTTSQVLLLYPSVASCDRTLPEVHGCPRRPDNLSVMRVSLSSAFPPSPSWQYHPPPPAPALPSPLTPTRPTLPLHALPWLFLLRPPSRGSRPADNSWRRIAALPKCLEGPQEILAPAVPKKRCRCSQAPGSSRRPPSSLLPLPVPRPRDYSRMVRRDERHSNNNITIHAGGTKYKLGMMQG